MLHLSRTVRFCLNDPPPVPTPAGEASDLDTPRHNTFSAWPAMMGLGRYYELTVTCFGEADPQTGYFINIKHIDDAVRQHVLPLFAEAIAGGPRGVALGALMQQTMQRLQPALHDSVQKVALHLSPWLQLDLERPTMHEVVTRQRYEFSAAHRLHVDALSAEENQQVFGKCNNPAGHGHNYQVEVAVRSPVDPDGRVLQVDALDACVDAHCIQRLDHKHLNIDVPAFDALNPSVENIVRVVWDMLQAPVADLGPGVSLDEISVWETGKTMCTYHAPPEVNPRK